MKSVQLKQLTMTALGSAAAGAIAMGIARDTRLHREMMFYKTQYRQARTELRPFLGPKPWDDNMGTSVFRALQSVFHSGRREGQRETLTSMGEGKIEVDGLTDHWHDMLRKQLPDWDLTPPKG